MISEIRNPNPNGRKRWGNSDNEEIDIKLTGEENAANENDENFIEIE